MHDLFRASLGPVGPTITPLQPSVYCFKPVDVDASFETCCHLTDSSSLGHAMHNLVEMSMSLVGKYPDSVPARGKQAKNLTTNLPLHLTSAILSSPSLSLSLSFFRCAIAWEPN